MKTVKQETYDFTITQLCTFTVQGSGNGKFEAEQDAIERFHRLQKSGDLVADKVTKPRVERVILNRK